MKIRMFVALGLAVAIAGCGSPGNTSPTESSAGSTSSSSAPVSTTASASASVIDLYVADQTKPCLVGPKPRECLLLREDPNAEWRLNWDGIDQIKGFTYEVGYLYHLRVEKTPLPVPPPDGAPFTLRLVEVVEKRPAG
jgi:Domain of unknown function (DUF4377)